MKLNPGVKMLVDTNHVGDPGPDTVEAYNRWLRHAGMPTDLLEELRQIGSDSREVEDRFYKHLEFGTGGMRGVIGAGTNRINVYTVRRAAHGIARYLDKKGETAKSKGVAIAYDSRKYSDVFALQVAAILAHSGNRVYLFQHLAPTPLLSFAIRHLQASAGIVITASHNPSEYNGIKVYNEEGGQITEQDAADIYAEIQRTGDPLLLPEEDPAASDRADAIATIGKEITEAYAQRVEQLLCQRPLIKAEGDSLSIVYTPLHGTGIQVIPDLLRRVGFSRVHLVPQQAKPDSEFPTVKAPNPEERDAFALALSLASEKQADLVMATDPDADRLGVLVKTKHGYEMLNGNQLGALLLHYLLEQSSSKGRPLQDGLVLKTIVTSDLGGKIAESYGVTTENTLTGFKYIGEKIQECQTTGSHTFVFGYEESYGYLAGDFVRDKDAVQIAVLVAEMVLVHRRRGKNLFEVLEEIYATYGYFREELLSLTIEGRAGRQEMEESIARLRENPVKQVAGYGVHAVEDYERRERTVIGTGETQPLSLPRSNVIKIIMQDGSWIAVRPSGTEPKMKVYFSAYSPSSMAEADAKMAAFQAAVPDLIGRSR